MCGIAGVVGRAGAPAPDPAELRRMAGVLAHRGPDDEGVAVIGPVGLVHRRLSIIDLSGGHQPFSSEDRRYTIVFNGEIYNFLELRDQLHAEGCHFRTRSDTEVILRAHERWGSEAVKRFNGMFAYALWDETSRTLFMARDRLGKKPLYYYARDGVLVFGSELKAILAWPGVDRELDPVAIDEFLRTFVISAPRCIFRHIRKIRPAHFLLFREGEISEHRYWSLRFGAEDHAIPEKAREEELAERFRHAVERRLISDVPLGALLSGGIDSSAVVGMMAQTLGRRVTTFTIGFDEKEFSELEDARTVARHFQTDHQEFIVRPDAVDILPRLVWHFDEPFGDSSAVPTFYVSQLAASHVKVVLSGDGGDELFAGYTRYQDAARRDAWGRVPAWVRSRLIAPVARGLPVHWPGRNLLYALGHHWDLAPGYGLGPFPYIREHLYTKSFREIVGEGFSRAAAPPECQGWEKLDRLSRLQYLDTVGYLPDDILTKVDRASMAHGLEVRSPLLDYELVEHAARLPHDLKLRDGTSKYLFRKLAGRYLPPSVFQKRKQGFAIPKAKWFRDELRVRTREALLDRRSLSRGYFRRPTLERMLRDHVSGRQDYSDWLWNLLMLEEWHRVFVDPDTRRV